MTAINNILMTKLCKYSLQILLRDPRFLWQREGKKKEVSRKAREPGNLIMASRKVQKILDPLGNAFPGFALRGAG